MNSFHKEILLGIIREWSDLELDSYIHAQEERLENTKELIRGLKEIRRKRNKRRQKPLETGVRGGL